MEIYYSARLGSPLNCNVVYDAENKIFKTENVKTSGRKKLLTATDMGMMLYLHFVKRSGAFHSLDFECAKLSDLPEAKLSVPTATDGLLFADFRSSLLPTSALYFELVERTIGYDEQNKLLLFGNFSDDSGQFRVMRNVYVSIDKDGGLEGILISL